jgi:hypothetical protein
MEKYQRVVIDFGYVVIADDKKMFDHAACLLKADVEWECEHGDIKKFIRAVDAPEATSKDVEEYLYGDNLDDDLSNLPEEI